MLFLISLLATALASPWSAKSNTSTIVWKKSVHPDSLIGTIHAPSATCGTQGYPSGKTTLAHFTSAAGKARTYHVYVPENYDNTKPVALHLAFSGLNAPCMNVFNGWKKTAADRGYILVAPCATTGSMGLGWNSGTCCGFSKNSKIDEFEFTSAILKDVKSKLCVDSDRVFASGFSNGAMMSEVLACKMNGVFRAVASVSGVVELRPGNKGGLAACDAAVKNSTMRTSVLNVHGTADPLVPWGGNVILGFPKIPLDLQRWAARSGCSDLTGKQTFAKGKYNNTIWSEGCSSGSQYELVRNKGGSHEWPQDDDFDTTTYIQSFFDRVSGDSAPEPAVDLETTPVNDEAAIARINAGGHGWIAGKNARFEGSNLSHVAALCGTVLKGEPEYFSLPELHQESPDAGSIPNEFDARTKWPACPSIGHIRDQSACGSCWAFGSTEAFNDRRCIATGDPTLMSVEDTTACCGIFNCFSQGCGGGQPSGAWHWFSRSGVVSGGDFGEKDSATCLPYTMEKCAHHVPASAGVPACPKAEYSTPKCSRSCVRGFSKGYAADKRKASSAYSLSSIEQIQQDIMTNGPVTGAFSVYSDFPTYKSGVYTHTSGSMLGGHAIKILGWGVEDGTDYWLVANSWNEFWGDKGFFKIKRGVDECGIESQISAGHVSA